MPKGSTGESPKAQRDRIRRALLKCLKPIQEQEDSFLGCLLAFGAYPLIVWIIRIYFDTSWLASLGWAVLGWLAPLLVFGMYIDSAEKRSRGRGYEVFERTYAPGGERRAVALSVLRDMARDEAHSHSKAASLLLTELGEDLLSEPAPESQLKEQLKEVAANSDDLAPVEWKEPMPAPPRQPRRYDHIPLDPEDPDGAERKH